MTNQTTDDMQEHDEYIMRHTDNMFNAERGSEENFDFFYDNHFWKKSIKRNLFDKITGQPYFYPEKDDAKKIWQAATAAAEAKIAQEIHDLEHAERQLAKVAAENMRLREAEGEYLPVIEKLAQWVEFLEGRIDNDLPLPSPNSGIHKRIVATLALATPLLRRK